jgi:hypothetical protein
MLPIKKIYIDTRQRTADSVSHSDFSIDLPTTLLMPDDTGFYVEDICIPVSWWSIEEFVNDLLFMQFDGTFRTATITPGNYTTAELGTEIARAINEGFSAPRFATEFRKSQGAIIIKWADSYILNDQVKSFKVFTNSELTASGASERQINRSINNLLKNFTSNMNYIKAQPFVSGFVDMNPVRNAYLTCTGLGNFNTMSLTGDRNIIKKISINGQPGDIIFDSSQTGVDYLDCSRQTLSRISFQLRDNTGRILNLRGIHWSFSLVFSRVQNGI